MKLKLGEKTFDLKPMTLNQIKELEERGINLMAFAKEGEFKMSYIADIVHIMVKKQDPSITLEWVGEQIDMNNFPEVSEKITGFLAPKGGRAKPLT